MEVSRVFATIVATIGVLVASGAFAQVPAPPVLLAPNASPPSGWPDGSNTGVPAGVTLTSCNGNITTNGATLDSCLFSSGVNVTAADNVRITRSRIIGSVKGDYSDSNLIMEDVEIDGKNSTMDATNGLNGWTCRRCKVHNNAKCFTGEGFTVEDSYCYDLYGSGSGAGASHNEAVLGSGTDGIIIRHNNLVSNWNAARSGGGMSSVISLYSHGTFWGPLDNVLMENNRIENPAGAYYCIYGGNSPDHDPINVDFTGNVFIGGPNGNCKSPFIGWNRNGQNTWSNNRYDTGEVISEPPTGNYN